jgi:hypothetical protein
MRSPRPVAWLAPTIAVGGLVLLVLYAYSAGFLSVSADEFARIIVGRRGMNEPWVWFDEIWLPLHFVCLGVTSLLTGDLLLASRLVSIAFGTLLVVALWQIGQTFAGESGGGFAAFLGATHPLVVLLSATAMSDICYVALTMLALRYYLKAATSADPDPTSRIVTCGLLTVACGFHYNAWVASVLLVPFLLYDRARGVVSSRVLLSSLLLLSALPLGWMAWNWMHKGHALAIYGEHAGSTAKFWESLGWHASPRSAIRAVSATLRLYSPLPAVLAFAAPGSLFRERSVERGALILWSLLGGFLGALVLMYTRGGRPGAFDARYVLLPSVLMIVIAAGSLGRLVQVEHREARTFVILVSVASVLVNLLLTRESIRRTKEGSDYPTIAEARGVATVMANELSSEDAPRMLLQFKYWNFDAVAVYLNRFDAIVRDRDLRAIVRDRAISGDPSRDHPSMLLGPRDRVLAELRTQKVGFIAVWSPEVKHHVEPWGLEHFATAGSYAIYRIPWERERPRLHLEKPMAVPDARTAVNRSRRFVPPAP